MTPREKIIKAFNLEKPEGLVPTLELEFQLSEELFGEKLLRAEDLKDKTKVYKEDLLKKNAENLVRIAKILDYSVITGIHFLSVEDQIKTYDYIKEISGQTYMLSAFIDGTYSIPSGNRMLDFVYEINDNPQKILEEAEIMANDAIKTGIELIKAGAEVIFMCSDYCFNSGPFLSPEMFAKFVKPFLKKQISSFKKAGAFTVKHTDGNIMPILDQLLECEPTALHSLDPIGGIDIKKIKEKVKDKLCLIGNVNCAYL